MPVERIDMGGYTLIENAPLATRNTLRVNARSEDGVVQGVVHRELPVHGVQFHPESVLSERGDALVENFLRLCHPELGEGSVWPPRKEGDGTDPSLRSG